MRACLGIILGCLLGDVALAAGPSPQGPGPQSPVVNSRQQIEADWDTHKRLGNRQDGEVIDGSKL